MSAHKPSEYWQRVSEMMEICGPHSWPSLFATRRELDNAQAVVKTAAAGFPVSHQILVDAQYLTKAARHPDTGEIILLPFRMCAHVPVNACLLVGMLASKSVFWTGAWQCANQCFNAAQFYANRNASNTVTDATLLASFSGAVVSSVVVGSGLRSLFIKAEAATSSLSKSSWRSRAAVAGSLAVPFLAAAAGKPLQIGLMRQDEWRDGVQVTDHNGDEHGRSIAAGQAAVSMTIATRTLYLAPMLWMPVVQGWIERAVPLLQRNRAAWLAVYTLHTAVNSAFVTPMCIALFDQRASLPATALESGFQHLKDRDGRQIQRFYFNKGL